jgi:lysozyme
MIVTNKRLDIRQILIPIANISLLLSNENAMKHRVIHIMLCVGLLSVLGGCRGHKPASAYAVWGLDVSRHQQGIDWQRLCEADKPCFVFLKATEGTLIQDPSYDRHRRQLEEQGVLWGAYHFFGHRTSGKEQAQNFIKTARLKKGNLHPVLDIEPHRFFKDPKKLVREVQAFCDEIRREYGVYPILYSSSNFYARYLRTDFPEKKYYIWIADYSNIPEIDWLLWQHTDSHAVNGYSRGVDRNVFAGKTDELDKMILK